MHTLEEPPREGPTRLPPIAGAVPALGGAAELGCGGARVLPDLESVGAVADRVVGVPRKPQVMPTRSGLRDRSRRDLGNLAA